METIVHLMRHGQVDNPRHVLYERLPNFYLSDLGVRQAELASRFFEGRAITHLRCSPLERAQQSIRPVAALFPELAIVTDERVIEAGNLMAGQVMGRFGRAAWQPQNWHLLINPLRPSWGEPYADMATRMTAAIVDAAEAAGTGEAVVVSHQLPIWMARRAAEGRALWHDPRRRQCTLCSVTSFHVADGTVIRIEYAEPTAELLADVFHFGF